MKKDAYYFSHDANAQQDFKMIKLRKVHGWSGYGLFWAIVERLRNESDYSLERDYDTLSYEMRVDQDIIQSIIEDFDLFNIDGDCFYSKRLNKCMEYKDQKSEKARESARKRWDRNATAKQSQKKRTAKKVKESKVKESKKDNKSLESIDQEFLNELQEKHLNIDVPLEFEKFKDYLSANGKRYRDYRAGFRMWVKQDFCAKTDKIINQRKEVKKKQARIREKREAIENQASAQEIRSIVNSVAEELRTRKHKS